MEITSIDPTSAVFNHDELIARCMGNLDFAERILNKFQERCNQDVDELEREFRVRNIGAVTCLAHRIKGAAANVSAPRLQACAAAIESFGRAEQFPEIQHRLEQLRNEWSRFVDSVESLNSPQEALV